MYAITKEEKRRLATQMATQNLKTQHMILIETGHTLGVQWWAVRDLNPRPPARHAGALAN